MITFLKISRCTVLFWRSLDPDLYCIRNQAYVEVDIGAYSYVGQYIVFSPSTLQKMLLFPPPTIWKNLSLAHTFCIISAPFAFILPFQLKLPFYLSSFILFLLNFPLFSFHFSIFRSVDIDQYFLPGGSGCILQ
jgi:hypothetical protein